MGSKVAKLRPAPGMPGEQVVLRKVEQLTPYERNARKHSDTQVDQLVEAIKRWGFTVPLLIDEDNGVLAGHGRLLAAIKLGLPDVPCVIARGWDETKKRAYAIADNKLGLNSQWDDELLKLELHDLQSIDGGLAVMGFSEREIESVMETWASSGAQAATAQLGDGMAHRVIVDCADERQQAELIERFRQEGLKCRALIS
jgi:ParB-like chromosome segregation protein Spo0J